MYLGASLLALMTLTVHAGPGIASGARLAAAAAGHMRPGISLTQHPQAAIPDGSKFHCQRPPAQFHCYGPAQIRTAYAIQPLIDAGNDGSGQVITIIDAFQNPTMTSDLATFDSTFALPQPPSFTTIAPFGLTPFDPTNANQVGWAGEIALDVEWAHAVAPGASIVLALSRSDADPDLVNTERYVINHRIGSVISMSFGEGERCMNPALQATEHALFATATAHGMSLFAASGDQGAAEYCTDPNALFKGASIPASDPNVTGVGGTQLKADLTTGVYRSESVWNDPVNSGVGGGGFSAIYTRPSFQDGITGVGSMRGVPDVAYSAALDGAVIVALGSSGSPGEFWIFYGTSAGSPQWAGLVAIADQVAGHLLGNVNPALYAVGVGDLRSAAAFHDITTGNNSYPPIEGYAARRGWDAASGLGSPIADSLVGVLTHPASP